MFGMKRRKFLKRPVGEGPTGVWIQYPQSGRYEKLPVIYMGREDDGTDVFEVLVPIDFEEEAPTSMGVESLPGHTAVRVRVPKEWKSRMFEVGSQDGPE